MRSHRLTFPLVPRGPVQARPFGMMASSRRGPGWDVAGSRAYRPGDDVRRIDWRSSARLSSARGSTELVVREHTSEQATRVAIVVDRRPSMALFPPELPWLSKPAALAEARELIVESAVHARCLVADGDGGERGFGGSEEGLAASLEELAGGAGLPPASFVFVLSDFLGRSPDDVWRRLLAREWDVVPVVIQDPVWEQSFPDVAGAALELAEPGGSRAGLVALGRAEVAARRRANEERLASILGNFASLGLDWVLLSRDDPGSVVEAFRGWAAGRRGAGVRLA